jgi:hypothetical protein
VEYYVVEDRICAFVISPRSIRVFRNLAAVADVAFTARRLRYQMQRVSAADDAAKRRAERHIVDAGEVLARLYDLLLRPLEAALTAEQVVVGP